MNEFQYPPDKACVGCNKNKKSYEFRPSTYNQVSGRCIECLAKKHREYYMKNRIKTCLPKDVDHLFTPYGYRMFKKEQRIKKYGY